MWIFSPLCDVMWGVTMMVPEYVHRFTDHSEQISIAECVNDLLSISYKYVKNTLDRGILFLLLCRPHMIAMIC